MARLPVRERLIETASDLFYSQGYNLTGINEILEKSGVAKASMYQHFRSKEDICLEFLKRMDSNLMEKLNALVASYPEGPQRVLSLFDFLTNFFNEDGFRGCWCLNTISELPRNDKRIMTEIRLQKNQFKTWIEQLIVKNGITQNSKILANKIYLLYEGAIVESQVHMDDWPILEAKSMAREILMG